MNIIGCYGDQLSKHKGICAACGHNRIYSIFWRQVPQIKTVSSRTIIQWDLPCQ